MLLYTPYNEELNNLNSIISSPGKSLKLLEMARLKRKQSAKKIRRPKRRLILDDKVHYGEECQKPDMFEEEYELAKNIFLQNLQQQVFLIYIDLIE